MEPKNYQHASQYLDSDGLEGFLEADRLMSRGDPFAGPPQLEFPCETDSRVVGHGMLDLRPRPHTC